MYCELSGSFLGIFQPSLDGIRVIIIDEDSIMGRNIILYKKNVK